MQSADFQRFKSVMAGMGRVFGADADGVLLDAYWLALRDWSLPEFEEAAAHLMRTIEFMPRPSAFVALRKVGAETAGEAWGRVLARVRTMWPTERVSVDPRIDRVVHAMGGYAALCATDSSSMPFREKRFAELWEELGTAEHARESLPLLAGDAPKLEGPRRAVPMVGRG